MKEVKRPVVSVVVPVYNTEPFLAECLHSLEKQTLTDIEIILVNDGSTDNSGRLLREYAGKDARFVYVEQENQGLSAARNTGMEHASGHYLAFLDSDDWLAENALQVLCAIAAKTRTDIVSGNTLAVHADGQVQSWERRGRELFATGTVVSGSTYFSRVMDCRCYVPMVYNYLYRRDFIEQNGFRFEPGLVHEDELWTPQVLTYSGFYNIGVKEIWDMVYAYIDFVRKNGYFEHRRNEQAKYWMYETINEHLRDSFYQNPEIASLLPLQEKDVLEGRATSFSAARKLLEMYFSGLKQE